jgi:nucleotide-binding universal stress UspA family protein
MKTILVGYDETEPAKRALERAAQLAGAFGARLIVTSIEPSREATLPPESVGPALALPRPTDRAAGGVTGTGPPDEWMDYLERAKLLLEGFGVEAELVADVGDPGDTIVRLAEERDVDLIVVGTRDPSLLRRLLGQSVSESVVRHADRDVLVVR